MLFIAVLILLPALALGDRTGDAFGRALFALIKHDNLIFINDLEFSTFVKLFDKNGDGLLFYDEFLPLVAIYAPLFLGNEHLLYYVLASNWMSNIDSNIRRAIIKINLLGHRRITLVDLQRAFGDGSLLRLTVGGLIDIGIGK